MGVRFLALLFLCAHAQALTLVWDASPDATGYHVHWGTKSGQYTQRADAGNTTALSLEPSGHLFFAVTAYNEAGESDPSNEAQWPEPARIDHLEVWHGTVVLFIDGGLPATVERSLDLFSWEIMYGITAPAVAVDRSAGTVRFYRLRGE